MTQEQLQTLDNYGRIADEYGNYFVKVADNDYRYLYMEDPTSFGEYAEQKYTREQLLQIEI